LAEVSPVLANIVHGDSSLALPLADVRALIAGKLASAERNQDVGGAIRSLDRTKEILKDGTKELRFEHGVFGEVNRCGGIIGWLRRFLGWEGSSEESQAAAASLIDDLKNVRDDLLFKRESNRMVPRDLKEIDHEQVLRFFNDYLLQLHHNEWFNSTLKHNPQLKEAFADVNGAIVRALHTGMVTSPEDDTLQHLAENEKFLEAMKQYGTHFSPEQATEFEVTLQKIADQKCVLVTREIDDLDRAVKALTAGPDFEERIAAIEKALTQLRELVGDEVAVASGCDAMAHTLAEKRKSLQLVNQALTALIGEKGLFGRVETLSREKPFESPIEDVDALLDILKTMYTYLLEAATGDRPVTSDDLPLCADINRMLDRLSHNAAFGAAAGEKFAEFQEFPAVFAALPEEMQKDHSSKGEPSSKDGSSSSK
jgi:hypothetical protein